MLKHRIIPTLLWSDGALVKGTEFNAWRSIGTVLPAVRVHCIREVDELLLLDIQATPQKTALRCAELEAISESCRVPLTVGGGIRSVAQVREILRSGADKVLVNSAAYEDTSLIGDIADAFGRQVLVVGVDVRRASNGEFLCLKNCGNEPTGRDLREWCLEVQRLGAGEIMIQSVSRDGTMAGLELEMVQAVVSDLRVPLIVSGGCSGYEDMRLAFEAGASAVAASALFQFTEATPAKAKAYLAAHGIAVRKG